MATLNKIIVLIFFELFIGAKIYSQNADKIKNADTVYVFFKETPYKQLYMPQKDGWGEYHFYFENYSKLIPILFYHTPKTPEEKNERKSFLRKNKDIIVDYNFLTSMYSYDEAKNLLLNKKKIFIIDSKEIKCSSIKLNEVKVLDYTLNPIE